MLKLIKAIFYAELVLRIRHSQEGLYPIVFFILVISLFPLALSPDPLFLQTYIAGAIWIAALLASLLSIESIFYTDKQEGYIEQYLLSHLPLSIIVLIKISVQWLVTQLPLILLTPLLALIFHLSFRTIFMLELSLIIGTPILTCVGSVGAALTLGLKQQGVLLNLLILPLVLPVLIMSVTIVQRAETGLSSIGPLTFLVGISLIAFCALPAAIAAILKLGIEN